MATKRKPEKSRLREKAARAPRPQFGRFEKSISKYLEDVRPMKSEPARLTRFTILLNELFGDLDFPLLRDFLAGFETKISTREGRQRTPARVRPGGRAVGALAAAVIVVDSIRVACFLVFCTQNTVTFICCSAAL